MNLQTWFRKNVRFSKATVFAKNVCPRSQRLHGHRVSVVDDYADTQ